MYSLMLEESIANVYKAGNKVLICGNGGLCAESDHFAAELMGKFGKDVYISCISLSNATLITALGNDFGFERIFAHQVEVLGRKGDVFIGMTTSESPDVLNALGMAKYNNLITVAICSQKSEVMADQIYRMGGNESATIQENVLAFLHHVAYSTKKLIGKG